MDTLDSIVKKALSRRGFMAGAGSVAAASLVAGCSDDSTVALPVTSVSYTDTDILNFALNTEYLEAEFYLRAATGAGLPTSLLGSNPGNVNLPSTTKVTTQYNGAALTSAQQNILNEIAYTEQQHVATLRSALGSAAISRPTIDYVAGFNGLVTAANAISSTASPTIPSTFSPFSSFDAFALTSGGFEDLGVTAYSGAAPLISAAGIQAGLLATAGGILAKEAYSGGMMRAYLTANAVTLGSTTYPYAGYFNRLGLLYNALSGTSVGSSNATSVPLAGFGTAAVTVATATSSQVAQALANGLAPTRSTDQVLHVVYGTYSTTSGSTTPSAGVSSGGFFPSGLAGNIKVTQS